MEKQIVYLSKRFYDLDFKHKLCKEHIDTKIGISDLARKYNLSSHTLLHHWLRELGYIRSDKIPIKNRMIISFEKESNINMSKNPISTSNDSPVELQIAILEQELLEAKLLAEGYKEMIELAEKELKISIRKKFNSK